MKNIWKWVLGIVLVLVLGAGLFGLGFFYRTRLAANTTPRVVTALQTGRGPWHGGFPEPRGGRMGFSRGPMMMRGFARVPFLPGMMFFGLFGRLLPLALVLLLLYAAYQFGKKDKTSTVVIPVPAAPAVEPPPSLATHPCPACGQIIQDDWKHCPNCGTAQNVT